MLRRSVELVENPDILAALVAKRSRLDQVLVGFAAETGDSAGGVLDHARVKLERKGCDLLVANDVAAGAVFGSETNAAVILSPTGQRSSYPWGRRMRWVTPSGTRWC